MDFQRFRLAGRLQPCIEHTSATCSRCNIDIHAEMRNCAKPIGLKQIRARAGSADVRFTPIQMLLESDIVPSYSHPRFQIML